MSRDWLMPVRVKCLIWCREMGFVLRPHDSQENIIFLCLLDFDWLRTVPIKIIGTDREPRGARDILKLKT